MEQRDFGEMVAYFNRKVADMDIAQKYKMELLGMITAIEIEHDELVPKWIPFEVALPNDRQKVLCVNKHDEMMVGGYMTDYGMTFPCYFEKPIAWMPLPEPWRAEEWRRLMK